MKWWLILPLLFCVAFATYDPDDYNSIQSTLRTSYTADPYNNIELVFGEDEGARWLFIELFAPANESQVSNDTTPQFNFTVNGSKEMCSCELFINGTGYGTNSSVFNTTLTTIEANGTVSLEWHEWHVNCSNMTLMNSSDVWVFNMSYPDLQFLYSGVWCYQETANKTSTCGGLATGAYNFTWNGTSSNTTNITTTGDLETGTQTFSGVGTEGVSSYWTSIQTDLEQDTYCYYNYTTFALFNLTPLGSNTSSDIDNANIVAKVDDLETAGTISDIVIWEIENITWTESNLCPALVSIVLNTTTKQINTGICDTDEAWCNINITNVLKGALDAGHSKLSIRIHGKDDTACGLEKGISASWRISNSTCGGTSCAKFWDDRTVANEWPRLNVTFVTESSNDVDANKTAVTYNNVTTTSYEVLNNLTVIINVSYYNTAGSISNANTNATLWLEVYNGSEYLNIGTFSVNGTGNFSKIVTTTSIMNAWNNLSNRDFKVSARFLDYVSAGAYDTINWTAVWIVENYQEVYLSGTYLSWDENWSSGSSPAYSAENYNGRGYFYVNYSKPTAISSQSRDWDANDYSLWMVKDGTDGDEEERNISMEYTCWQHNPLQFRVELNRDETNYFIDYTCWEGIGSGWVSLYNRTGSGSDPILYEEAMYWYAGCPQLEFGVWLGENGMTNATYQDGENQCVQLVNNGTEPGFPTCRVNQTVYGLVPQISTSYNFNCTGELCHNLTTAQQYIYSLGPVNTSMAVDDTLDCYFRWYYNSSYSFPNTQEIDCVMAVTG